MNTRLACVGVLMAAACGAVFAQTGPGGGPTPLAAPGQAYPTKPIRLGVHRTRNSHAFMMPNHPNANVRTQGA